MAEVSARRAQTRVALIEAATKVFATRGIDASVEELSEAAGFTRGAFYSNFSSKTELCAAMIEHYMQRDLSALEGAIPRSSDNHDDLITGAIDNFTALWGHDPQVLLALHLVRLAAGREPELRAAVVQLDQHASRAVRTTLTDVFERHNVKLRLPMEDLLMAMRSVYFGALVDALLVDDVDPALLRDRLMSVVRALIVPAAP